MIVGMSVQTGVPGDFDSNRLEPKVKEAEKWRICTEKSA